MAEQTSMQTPKFWARFRLRYRIIWLAVCVLGLVLCLASGKGFSVEISRFAVQANLLCLVLFGVLAARDWKKKCKNHGKWSSLLKGGCTVWVLTAFAVERLVLAPQGQGSEGFGNVLLLSAAPIMTALDYVLFDKKGAYKVFHPFVWLSFPAYYLGYTALYAALGGGIGAEKAALYFFFDAAQIGTFGVVMWCAGLVAGILLIGFILVGVDRWLAEIRDN